MCDTTHSNVWHDSITCVIWLIHMCDMTHSYKWHDSFICVTSSRRCRVWRDSFMRATYSFIGVTCLIHVCDTGCRVTLNPANTPTCVWVYVCVCVCVCVCAAWRIHTCEMIHVSIRGNTWQYVAWLNHLCAMTYSYVGRRIHTCGTARPHVWRDSCISVAILTHGVWHDSSTCVTWLIHTCDMTHSQVWHDPCV